ncbi:DUF3159 domain-containing protein [Gleimia hominis]|uniref:DUF3159 domain-containing protein n=1 Tax=Gleimia hominis TaxID=595468 RepID=A0ABU3IER9_9ACTO|nr:DUF3159 domain-containing protein [Gleimia hominis]MDT3767735.1 DUF3159 domain-containing protein [Gleimia hominis]
MSENKVQSAAGDLLAGGEFNMWRSVGGWRGVVESTLPGLVFVVVYIATGQLKVTLICAAVCALGLIGVRLLTRQSVTYSLSGLFGVMLGVVWAWWSGRGENFYAIGLITAAVYAVAILLTIVLRTPIVCWALTYVWQLPPRWWRTAQYRPLARVGLYLSWMWFALFAFRLAAQLPLWLSGQLVALGVVKLAVGLPPFILCAWATWAFLRAWKTPAQQVAAKSADSPRQ